MKKLLVRKTLCICLFILPVYVYAQEIKPGTVMPRTDTLFSSKKDTLDTQRAVLQKDIFDVFRYIFNKPASAGKSDSITSKPVFSVIPAFGYTLESRLAVIVAGNIAFRASPEGKVSAITASASYTQNKQFILPVQSNIWTKNNRYNLVGDFRFYKYPQSTFGLGSDSYISSEDPMDYFYFRFYEILLKQVKGNFFAGAGYILDYRWNISDKGTKNGSANEYKQYESSKNEISSGITLNALYDVRDNPINPSKGFYTSLQLRNSYKFLGGSSNWHSLIVDVRKYFLLPGSSENVVALWYYNWFILSGKPPYLDLPSTSWDSYTSTGRGYIQGRFRGARMMYAEAEYRFKITANGLLGGVVFANAQRFSAEPGSRFQSIQPGFGPGLRIKLNKVSKTNISIDYGFGKQGSNGLFINIGELF